MTIVQEEGAYHHDAPCWCGQVCAHVDAHAHCQQNSPRILSFVKVLRLGRQGDYTHSGASVEEDFAARDEYVASVTLHEGLGAEVHPDDGGIPACVPLHLPLKLGEVGYQECGVLGIVQRYVPV